MIVAKLILGGLLLFGAAKISDLHSLYRAEQHRLAHVKYMTLCSIDGEVVVMIVPQTLMDKDGRLPNVIEFQGKTYERGWTNDGNTDFDERLWFEIKNGGS